MIGPVSFVHDQRPVRVVFGAGRIGALADECDHLELTRVLLIATRYSTAAQTLLGDRVVATVTDPRAHVPVDQVHETLDLVERSGVDGVVAVGGGSSVGLAKAVALGTGVPILAVPTTYSGSEMTRVWGRTEGGRKQTGRDLRVAPRTVIYDPDLVAGLPTVTAAASAINAVAHAAEALYAPDRTALSNLAATEAIRVVTATLTGALDPTALLRGAYLAGVVLDQTTMGLHHKLCHVLGGAFDLPHASTHSVVLPHVLAYNLGDPAVAERFAAAGAHDLPAVVRRLGSRHGVPTSLRELGLSVSSLDEVMNTVLAVPPVNPRPVGADAVRGVLCGAFSGVHV
ncbi:Maleylacetate reductase [Rhodococcus fascians]|uniref:iron-containing alcohol dehydrogenase n=1 Tax=Rhodococcoides fascians TaxID=1828 RepID=UPI0016A05E25|nr:Maleylacetate reductase [Rhodococcus fascians]